MYISIFLVYRVRFRVDKMLFQTLPPVRLSAGHAPSVPLFLWSRACDFPYPFDHTLLMNRKYIMFLREQQKIYSDGIFNAIFWRVRQGS